MGGIKQRHSGSAKTHSRGVEVAGLYAGFGDFLGGFSTGGARRAARTPSLHFWPFRLDRAHNNCSTNQRAGKQDHKTILHRFRLDTLQTWKWTHRRAYSHMQQLTHWECKEEQGQRDQVESQLLIDVRDGVDGHSDEQRDTGKCWTLQEGQQDRREQEISRMQHTYPHGTQTQTWI